MVTLLKIELNVPTKYLGNRSIFDGVVA